MPFFRPTPLFRSTGLRSLLSTSPRARPQVRYATQDYGSGQGSPAGEKPQQQGKNPSEELEHPGPPPPKVAQGKSPSPDEKQTSSKQSSSSSSSSSSASKSGKSEGGDSKGSPQPKILNDSPPEEPDESVRKHNEEFEQRADRAHEGVHDEEVEKDKVSSKFWSGHGGRDRET